MTEEFDIEELRAIRAKMLGYEGRCVQVLDAIKDGAQLTPDGLERARALYTSLKQEIKAEAADSVKRWNTMSRAESCFYDQAIRRASIALKPKTNSNPKTSNWVGALINARGEFSYYLHNLNKAAQE
jgi:hypothetical protein